MFDDRRFLVVDDEETVCRGCRRILSSEGFRVETSLDACEALGMAVENDYAAILLDLRMPQMDGIQFLEKLRQHKPDVPVIIITGYPNVDTAASAMRLGATDYLTKPFTPEQISEAVRRLPERRATNGKRKLSPTPATGTPSVAATQEFRYRDEAWFQPVPGGALRVGAMLPRSQGATVEAVWPPRVGWVVHQGLPLAGATITGRPHLTVPSPVSGMVVARNELLLDNPALLWDEPCGRGWIACVRPARLAEEAETCRLRRVVLANVDETSSRQQRARLESLGCVVRVAPGLGKIGPALQETPDCGMLLMDAASLGEHGPELAARFSVAAPSTRIVVVASAGSRWESAYREQRIFYYAVEPFADNEIIDIVDAAFRPPAPAVPDAARTTASSEPLGGICITNANGEKVGLVAESGLLWPDVGLGREVARELADAGSSVELTPGGQHVSSAIHQAGSICDRVVILLARDTGRLPGTLVRDGFAPRRGDQVRTVTTLIVQPASAGRGPLDFHARTTAALAEHIAYELLSC